jgi:hypothetical protein
VPLHNLPSAIQIHLSEAINAVSTYLLQMPCCPSNFYEYVLLLLLKKFLYLLLGQVFELCELLAQLFICCPCATFIFVLLLSASPCCKSNSVFKNIVNCTNNKIYNWCRCVPNATSLSQFWVVFTQKSFIKMDNWVFHFCCLSVVF